MERKITFSTGHAHQPLSDVWHMSQFAMKAAEKDLATRGQDTQKIQEDLRQSIRPFIRGKVVAISNLSTIAAVHQTVDTIFTFKQRQKNDYACMPMRRNVRYSIQTIAGSSYDFNQNRFEMVFVKQLHIKRLPLLLNSPRLFNTQ